MRAQQWVRVVGACEAWDEAGTLTTAGKLAWARAFLELRLLDRAWIRLREIAESEGASPEALTLAVDLHAARGWGKRATPFLTRLSAADPASTDLPRLYRLVAKSNVTVPVADRAAEDFDGWLTDAEAYLAEGAFIKATAILERLQRQQPTHPRVRELLLGVNGPWALQGSLWDLVAEMAPLALAEVSDEPEHTESLTGDDRFAQPPSDEGAPSFPALFRQDDGGETDAGPVEREVTQPVEIVALSTHSSEVTPVGPANIDEDRGDTKILKVIQCDGGTSLSEATGPIHDGVVEEPTFDFQAFRREMGMEAPFKDLGHTVDDLEDEDEGLIVVTRREHAQEPTRSGQFSLIDLDPSDEVPLPVAAPPPPAEKPANVAKAPRWSESALWGIALAIVAVLAIPVLGVSAILWWLFLE